MTKSRGIRPYVPRRPWAPWEHELLRELYPHVETAVVAWFLDRSTKAAPNVLVAGYKCAKKA